MLAEEQGGRRGEALRGLLWSVVGLLCCGRGRFVRCAEVFLLLCGFGIAALVLPSLLLGFICMKEPSCLLFLQRSEGDFSVSGALLG